jgi:probable HAF family extracellular repeat protein
VGFRWSPAGTVVPASPAGVAWKAFNGVDVNDRGTLVGQFGELSFNSMSRGYRSQAGISEELLTPLGLTAFPAAINDKGWIVGMATQQPGGTPGAVVWSPELVPSFVGGLSRAVDINNDGQIIGYLMSSNQVAHAWLQSEGRMIPLGSLDPANKGDVYPRAINDAGTIVGSSEIGSKEHAFRWTKSGGMTELPGLGFSVFPFDVAALDINAAGEIVGYAPAPGGQTSVIWQPDGTVTQLDTLVPDIGQDTNWPNLLGVLRINAAGQIAATAVHKPSGFQSRMVLLTPAALHATLDASAGELSVTGAAPGRPVYLAAGDEDTLDAGYTVLPGCAPIGLSLRAPVLLAVAQADASGEARFRWPLPTGFGATLRLQACQLDTCAVSNVIRIAP